MLGRLRANPLIRVVLLAVALAFCGFGLASESHKVIAALGDLRWYSVFAAFAAAVAGTCCMMLAWRAILADLGSRLRLPAAARVSFISQIGKYLPGTVWAFAAQVDLGRDHEVPVRRSATAIVISLAVTLETGLFIGTIALPLASANAARHYWWLLALTPLIALCLLPPVLGTMLDRALALAKRQPLESRPSVSGLITAVGWCALGWLLWGLQAWLLIAGVSHRGTSALLLGLGSYALAWSVGFVVVVFPGGIGPRDLAFVAALAPVMPRGAALVVALISRVVMTASDVALAGIGVAISRLAKHSRAPATDSRRPTGRHKKTSHQPVALDHAGVPGEATSATY